MDKISNITKRTFGNKDLIKAAEAAFICSIAKRVLRGIFDKNIFVGIKINSFSDGNLCIAVPDNFYAQEIKLKEKEIIEKIGGIIGEGKLKNIRFKSK